MRQQRESHQKWGEIPGVLLWAWAALLVGTQAYAGGSVGTSVTTGTAYTGLELRGDVDVAESWSVNASVLREDSNIDYKARNSEFGVGGSHLFNESHGVRAGFSYWQDSLNEINYKGPTAGYTYTWNKTEDLGAETVSTEVLSVFIDGRFLQYSAAVPTNRASRISQALTENSGSFDLTQGHLNLEVDKPLFEGLFLLYGSIGRYFYSDDPRALDLLIGRDNVMSRTGARWMVGGLIATNWGAGAVVSPLANLELRADFGGYQSALTGEAWSQYYGLGASYLFDGQYRARVGGGRSILFSGQMHNYLSAGLTYLF